MKNILKRSLSFFLVIIIIFASYVGFVESAFDWNFVVRTDGASVEGEDVLLTLPTSFPVGKYTLRYERFGMVLSDYAEICTLEVDGSGNDVSYDNLIEANTAPADATNIGIYNEENEKVGDIDLGDLVAPNLGSKLYSFAAFSDVHIGSKTAESDFKNALEYVENSPDVEFTTICGDFIHTASDTSQLTNYKAIVDTYTTKPVFAISGNHEAGLNNLGMEDLKPYTGQDLYYSFSFGNDVFIMVGNSGCTKDNLFADGELQWLYETLESNKDKRCFVFQHVRPNESCGNPWGIYDSDLWGVTEANVFESLMKHYPNVVFFHGHTHMEFGLQTKDNLANYDDLFGCHSVHIPSLSRPRTGDESGSFSRRELTDESEGYIVDVYENGVILKGRDFISGKFLPIASYSLNTTIKKVEKETYYDPTGTIINSNTNVLKAENFWYNSLVEKSIITEISFVNSYNGTPDEFWAADIADNGKVTVYREDTKLFIKGTENGIVANANSKNMFADFTNLKVVNGFENIDKSNIMTIEGMFKNCSKLVSVNLSSFSGVRPVNMANVFSGCNSLTEIDLSYLDLTVAKQYMNVFKNCTSLTSVTFGEVTNSDVYMCSAFKCCTSIENIDLSCFKAGIYLGETFYGCTSLKNVGFPVLFNVIALNGCFYDCASLETLDISSFNVSGIDQMSSVFCGCTSLKTLILPSNWDTSKVTTMYRIFCNCPLLKLDCSNWDTSSLVNMTSFKSGSWGVVAPEHKETIEIKEPTCTEQGYTILNCSVCGYNNFIHSYTDALGHSFGEWVTSTEPTCTTMGEKSRVCAECGLIESQVISSLGHDYSIEWTVDKEPTCTEDGSKSHHCSRCDSKSEVTVITTIGHLYGCWMTNREPTCTEPGSKQKVCSACGDVITEIISETGHIVVKDAAVEATCTTTGKTEGSHCSVCNVVIVAQTTIPAGHRIVESDWIIDKEATCTEDGCKHHECYVCGEVFDFETISSLGHTSSDWMIDKVATVNADGIKCKVCNHCGEVLETAVIPQLKCATPKLTKAANTVSGVKVTWGAVEGADSYRVYRRAGGVYTWSYIGTTTDTSFTDSKATNNKYWIYTVIAVNEAGYSGFDKVGKTIKCVTAPKVTGVSNAANGLYVKWNAVPGAKEYRVYRKGLNYNSWLYLGTTKNTWFTDSPIKNANGYYYKYTVIAVNDYYSGFYEDCAFTKRLSNPVLKSAVSSKTGITVKWNSVYGSTGYYVYRKTANSGWTLVGSTKGANNATYIDKTAKKGVTYTYTVRAYYGKTLSSYNSGISCKDKY